MLFVCRLRLFLLIYVKPWLMIIFIFLLFVIFLLIIKRKKKSKRETLKPLSILLLLTYKSILKISSFYWKLKSKVLIIFVVKFIFFKRKRLYLYVIILRLIFLIDILKLAFSLKNIFTSIFKLYFFLNNWR